MQLMIQTKSLYAIWDARNSCIFYNNSPDIDNVILNIVVRVLARSGVSKANVSTLQFGVIVAQVLSFAGGDLVLLCRFLQ